jgi:hypothetical protein
VLITVVSMTWPISSTLITSNEVREGDYGVCEISEGGAGIYLLVGPFTVGVLLLGV